MICFSSKFDKLKSHFVIFILNEKHYKKENAMKQAVLWALLFFCFLIVFNICFFTKQSFADETIKVMTFNLRYGTAMDGPNHWNKRKDILVEVIKHYDPDLLGTQECLDFQAKYIAEQIPSYSYVGRGREKDGSSEQTTVFYKKDLWEILDTKYFWISETPEEAGSKSWDTVCTRIVTWLKLKHRASGKEILFINTHLDHKGEIARQKGAEIICERIKTESENLPIIITADFNAVAEKSETWKIFMNNGFYDSWLKADEKIGPLTTWCGFKDPNPNSDYRIDWILYRGPFHPLKCETVVYNKDGRYPSDHFPVITVFKSGL